MQKLIIIMMITFGIIQANDIHQQYSNIHAKTRTFKTPKEFQVKKDIQKKLWHTQNDKKYINSHLSRGIRHHQHISYNDIYDIKPQRGYRHPQRDWFYAYRYTKADFVDRYGFYYGYFDRRGYMFEGDFYRYDRDYRYQDRLRGRGLFDRHLYYAPLPRIYRDDLYR